MLLPSGCGLGTAWAGRPHVVQELQCPTLQRGRRRGGLLIAREAVRDGGRDDGPAGELGLERCHGGDLLERGADPQEVGLRLVLDRGVERLGEERGRGLSHPTMTVRTGSWAGTL